MEDSLGTLVSITWKPSGTDLFDNGFTRLAIDEADLVAGYGIDSDQKGGREGRHLNILDAEALQTLGADGFRTNPGQIGEQLIVEGVGVCGLDPGARIQIGDALIRMVKLRTGCDKFERHQGKCREDAAGRLGMMAEVLTGGRIQVGDPVTIVDASGSAD